MVLRFTIVGERLELARLAFNEAIEKRILTGSELCSFPWRWDVLIVLFVASPFRNFACGTYNRYGHDVARKTITIPEFKGLSAVAMLAGYGWVMPWPLRIALPATAD